MAGVFGGKTNAAGTPHYTRLQVQTSAEGVCIPIVYGFARVAPNLINAWNFQANAVKHGKGGGKGGGGKGAQQMDYRTGVKLALCEGEINGVGKTWLNNNITTYQDLGLTLNFGSATQTGSGQGDSLDYHRTAYFENASYDLGTTASLPQHNFEVAGAYFRSVTGTPDANPADIIYDLLTNPDYGLGMDPVHIGDRSKYSAYCLAQSLLMSPVLSSQEQVLSTLQRWAQLTNSWIFWSGTQLKFVPLGDSSMTSAPTGGLTNTSLHSAGSAYHVGDVLTVTGGDGAGRVTVATIGTLPAGAVATYTVTAVGAGYAAATNVATSGGSGSGFTLNIYIAGSASYVPDLTPVYALTFEDFQGSQGESPITVMRSDPADGYNWVKIEISARDRDYNASTIEWKDQTSIDLYGLLQSQDVQAKEICDRAAGATIAQLVGKRAIYIRNTYTFKLGYNFVLLEPGDIVTLTEASIGLTDFPVRIRSIKEDDNGALSVEAEEFPASIGTPAVFPSQGWLGTLPPALNVDPGSVNYPAIIEPPASMTSSRAQIWFGLSGGPYWGGAQVWASVDDATYTQVGTVMEASPQGLLTTLLPSHADPDSTNTLSVDFTESRSVLSSAVTHADADAGRSLALIGQEFIGYGAVVPGGGGSFDFDITYLRRGYGTTTIAAHAIGTSFTAITPPAVLQIDLPSQYIGQTLYFKFPSYNIYGQALQDISVCTVYTYVPSGPVETIAPPSAVTLALTTLSGATAISITASWAASTGPSVGSYEVRFSIDGGATWTGPDVVVGASALTFTLSPATPNTSYQAEVSAISEDGLARSTWATSNLLDSGAAPTPSTLLALVNGDSPIGIVLDAVGVPVYVPADAPSSGSGGGSSGGGGGGGGSSGSTTVPMLNHSLYYLTAVNPADVATAATTFDVKVVDPTSDGGAGNTFWTSAQVAAMRGAGGIVLAYFDMGGAETFRYYYNTARTAGILSTSTNSWGEYSVEFWSSTWLNIAKAWADKALTAGFDGIYLDVADCYTDPWSISQAPSAGGHAAATQEAAGYLEIQFIAALRSYVRGIQPNFQVWQNAGEGLSDTSIYGASPALTDVIDGALREEVIYQYSGSTVSPVADTSDDYTNLARIVAAGKPVTLVEYCGSGGVTIAAGTSDGVSVGSGATNAIHLVRSKTAAWNMGFYISVADYPNPSLSTVDTEGITTP